MELHGDCERASLRASLGGRAVIQLGRKRAERTGVRIDFGSGGLAWAETGIRRHTLARGPRDMSPLATERVLRAALDAFRRGVEPPSSGRYAREIIAVIEGAYRSAETGTRVPLVRADEA
jgi:predicted dehydrogenase